MKKVLTIVRSKWLRGEGGLVSYLRRPEDGKMCCLGFDALACGFTPAQITGREDPRTLAEVMDVPADYETTRCSPNYRTIFDAMDINDNIEISDSEREERLIPLLKKIGGYDEVCFVD